MSAPRPRRAGKVGIRDVAAATGLSITSVSNALTGSRSVSDDVKARVESAAEELGYSASPIARAMRVGRTGVVGFISEGVVTQPHGGRMLLGAQDEAAELDKVLMIVNVPDVEHAAASGQINALLAQEVDSVIFASVFHRELTLPHALRRTNVVLLDCWDPTAAVPAIVPDEEDIGQQGAQLLLEQGHRRIVHLTIDASGPGVDGRALGFESALAGEALPASVIRVSGPADARAGLRAAKAALDRDPDATAYFCFNDQMAMGAYQAIEQRGLHVPTDLSVVGVDNLSLIAPALAPGLTTIELPHYEMGRAAVRTLASEGGHVASKTLIGGSLVQRHSVAGPRRPLRTGPQSSRVAVTG